MTVKVHPPRHAPRSSSLVAGIDVLLSRRFETVDGRDDARP
jgi:hypothetical protein